MRRYQQLMKEKAEQMGLRPFSRAVGIAPQSINNYLMDQTEPRAINLEKLAKYFGEPVAALLTDTGDMDAADNKIVAKLKYLSKAQKKSVLEFMESL